MGKIKKIVNGTVVEIDDSTPIKTIVNGVVVEKKLGDVKKKVSETISLPGGKAGTSVLPSGLTPRTDVVEVKETAVEPIIDFGGDPIKAASSKITDLSKLLERGRRAAVSTTAVAQPPIIATEIGKERKKERVESAQAKKTLDQTIKAFQQDAGLSTEFLMRSGKLQSPEQIDVLSKEQLASLADPTNETQKLAVNTLLDAKDIRNAIGSAKNLEEAAVLYAGSKDPQIARQIDISSQTVPTNLQDVLAGKGKRAFDPKSAFAEATRGRMLYQFLSNPVVFQELDKNPALQQEMKDTLPQLLEKYPDFGKMYLGQRISQKMEDMGVNNAILNVVTPEEIDKAVNALVQEGKMSDKERNFYNEYLRGEGGFTDFGRKILGRQIYDTPGLIESTLGGGVQGVMALGKGAAEITGLRKALLGEKEIVARDLAERDLAVNVRPKDIISEISKSGGQFLGQSLSIGGGGKALSALKAIKNIPTAVGVVGGLQAYANYIPDARAKFPGQELKQRGYATILSTLEGATENIFRDEKVVDGLIGKMKPEVKQVIQDFTSKKISAEAARQTLKGKLKQALLALPEATKYYGKGIAQETTEELASQLGQQITSGVFENKPLDEWINGQELFDTARQTILGSAFVAGLSARADMAKNKGISAKMIYGMAENPEYWAYKIQEASALDPDFAAEAQDKLSNLGYAARVYQDVQGTDMTEKQKIKYLMNALDRKVKIDQAESVTDPVLKKKAQEEASAIEAEQAALLEGIDDGSIEGDVSDVVLPEEKVEVPAKEKELEAGAAKVAPIEVAGTEISEHGEDVNTAEGKENGIKPAKLSEKGKIEAENLGQYIIDQGKTEVVSSPVERAKQTAEIAAEKAGVPALIEESLQTWDIGDFDGQPEGSFNEKEFVTSPDTKVPKGESFNDFTGRMEEAYQKVKDMPKTTQVVAHSKVIRAFKALDATDGKWTDQTTQEFLRLGEEEATKAPAPKLKPEEYATLQTEGREFPGQLVPTETEKFEPRRPQEAVRNAEKRQEVRTSLERIRDKGLLVSAETGKKAMTDEEIDAQMALTDAMANVWRETTGKDDFYETFIEDVKEGDVEAIKQKGGALFQDVELPQRPISRVSLAVFDLPQFQAMKGKMVAPQAISDLMKSRGKQIEKDIINTVLDYDKYKGQKRISFDDFKDDVEVQVMKLEKIKTSSYATYGKDSLGDNEDYGKEETIIFNSPIDHGQYGHFRSDFTKKGLDNKRWELKQLPGTDQWVAIDADMPQGVSQNEIAQYVGTAGRRADVERWIQDRSQAADQEINKGLFGHIRGWFNKGEGVYHLAELQSDYFQKNKASDLYASQISQDEVDEYINKNFNVPLHKQFINKFKNEFSLTTRLSEDGKKIFVLDKDGNVVEEENIKEIPKIGFEKGLAEEGNAVVRASYAATSGNEEARKKRDAIKDEYQKQYDKNVKEEKAKYIAKRVEEISKEKGENLAVKQFIASQKIHELRLFREALKHASEEGATTLRFPAPYTIAVIEAYVDPSGQGNAPYDIIEGDSDRLYEGDIIDYGGTKMIVVESSPYSITVAPQNDVYIYDIDSLRDEEISNRMSDLEYDLDKKVEDVNAITREEAENYQESEFLSNYVKIALADYFEKNPEAETVRLRDIREDIENSVAYYYNDLSTEDLVGWAAEVYQDGDTIYAVESRRTTERLQQPNEYDSDVDESNFESELSNDQETVVKKYDELGQMIKKMRPEAREVRDGNNMPWLEIDVTNADRENPVIAFQKEGAKIKGAIDFSNDNRASIYIFDGADISTLAHEISGHLGRRVLDQLAKVDEKFKADYEKVKKWAGVKDDQWTIRAEEKFARGFEKYLREGKAPTASLKAVFEKMRDWLTNIYRIVKGSPLDIKLTPEVIEVFDNLLKTKGYAVQEQAAGEVPVQPKARVSEKVEGRVPPTKPEEVTKEGEGAREEREMTGISNEETLKMRLAMGLPTYERPEPESWNELNEKADEAIKKGYNIENLLGKLSRGVPPTSLEEVILTKYGAVLANQFEVNQDPEALKKYEELTKITNGIGTLTARALNIRKFLVPKENTLADFFVLEKEETGVEELTEEQKAIITQEYNDIKAATEALQKKVEELQAENARLKAGENITEERKKAKKGRKTDKEFAEERKKIVSDIREKLKEARSKSQSSIVPYGNELITIAPDVAKLMKNLVENGVVKLEDIVTEIYNNLKPEIKDLEKKDVIDLIAGEYNRKKPSRSALAAQIKDLRDEATLLVKLEKLESGQVPSDPIKKIERSREIRQLKDRIKEHPLTKAVEEKRKIETKVASLEKELDNLRRKIVKERSEPIEDTIEIKKLKEEIFEAKKNLGLFKSKMAKPEEVKTPEQKKVERLQKELEDLKKGITKKRSIPIEDTPEIIALKQKIKEEKEKLPKVVKSELEIAKKKIATQIAKLEKDLADGNYDKKPEKREVPLDKEGKELQKKLMNLKRDREIRRLKNEYDKRSDRQKLIDKVTRIANVPRSLMASTDFSAPLNQAIVATIAYPDLAAKATQQMIKATASQDAFDEWFYDLKDDPRYELMKELKLRISDPHSPFLTAREEAFMGGYAEQIPGLGKLVTASERAYVQYLNKLRVDLFNRFIDRFEEQGKTFKNSPRLYQATAKYINNITGSGNLGSLEQYAPIFNAAFFSPRLMAARLQMLNPYYFATLPKELKVQYGKDMGSFLGLLSIVLTLFALYGKTQKDDDENKITVETDPTSTDFARIKVGDTRWDFSGGFQPYIRLFNQIGAGERKSTRTGLKQSLDGEGPFGTTYGDVSLSFVRNKLSPVPSMAVDFFQGRNAVGEKVTLQKELFSHIVPLSMQTIWEAAQEGSPSKVVSAGLPAIFGVGVQTYEEKPKEVKTEIDYKNREVKLNDDQIKYFQDRYDEISKKNLGELRKMKEYKSVDRETQVAAEIQVQKQAMKKAQSMLTIKYRDEFLKFPVVQEDKKKKSILEMVKRRF